MICGRLSFLIYSSDHVPSYRYILGSVVFFQCVEWQLSRALTTDVNYIISLSSTVMLCRHCCINNFVGQGPSTGFATSLVSGIADTGGEA